MITGDEIRSGRELLGLTQADLATQIGVTFRTIGNWERGVTSPQRYEARLRKLFVGQNPAPTHGLTDYSDTELLLEVSRRMSENRNRNAHTPPVPRPDDQRPAVVRDVEPHGSITRLSDRRPRIVSDDVDPEILELPFVADEEKPGDDPGEDEQ